MLVLACINIKVLQIKGFKSILGLKLLRPSNYFSAFFFVIEISNVGNKTKLVIVAVISVIEVSQPKACVPPNPLKTKMMNPTTKTIEV